MKREDAVGKAVLVVASPGYVLEGLRALLSVLSGVEVLEATGCASALEIMESRAPALVIVDDGLPGGGGMTIVTGVRSGRGDSRCIALVDDEQRREQARAAGADLVLVKGIPADSLLATVKEMLTEEAGLGNSHSPGGKGQSMNAEKHAARCADDDGSPIVNRL